MVVRVSFYVTIAMDKCLLQQIDIDFNYESKERTWP